MSEPRLQRTRKSLPEGYQFGDAAPIGTKIARRAISEHIPVRVAIIMPEYKFRISVDSDDMETAPR